MLKPGFVLFLLAAAVASQPLAVSAADLLFHVRFDGTAVATTAGGEAKPLESRGLSYAEGREGQAVRMTAAAKSLLSYAEAGNLLHERGTVAMWIRCEWPAAGESEQTARALFANRRLEPKVRRGSGSLQFWWHGRELRADVSDDRDSFVTSASGALLDGQWHHVAFAWDGYETRIYGDGRPMGVASDSASPMKRALAMGKTGGYAFSSRLDFDRFFVGSRDAGQQFDGLIDELRVYSAPLSAEEIAQLADAYGKIPPPRPDYARFCGGANPYVGTASTAPGTIPDSDLEPVEELRLGSAADIERLRSAKRFVSVGDLRFGSLGGVPYVEPGTDRGSRFAIRFTPPDLTAPLYVFDIDYPDDKVRTADIVIQSARHGGGDYTMQCGFAAGGEYANTGKILTHRTIWWTRPYGDAALVMMTARENAPAAVSAVRVYRVKSGRLPAVRVDEPKANADGWKRCVSLYFEDPAIGADFSVPGKVSTPEALCATIDRTVAVMRFTGENVFGYPGVWYQGLIGEAYNPRHHAPDFLSAWYEKFDREGDLYVVPTLNVNNMPVPADLVSLETMTNGALHSSPIAIHDTGKPNWGGWHSSPPNFNIAHPKVQEWILGNVEALIAQGARHPSFKGVAFHVAWHTMLSFGRIESGYNDYCIEAFERAKGVKVDVDRTRPLRGKDYADWIRARPEVYAKWIDWRCETVTAFWGRVAARLRAARPDLKLWINLYTLSSPKHPDYAKPDYATQVNREAGIDGRLLTVAAPNLILSQCTYPADPRWRGQATFKGDEAAWLKQLNYHAQPGTYRFADGADFPWAGQHDRYWESAIGAGKKHWSSGNAGKTLTCDWLKESPWRVSTINPSGYHALRHFVVPLRFHDVLGVSKGGFLIGTYGMEPHLAKFAQEFRSLPAVKMDEFFREGFVVARKAAFDGRVYGYVVNTEATPAEVTVPGYGAFRLAPYELKAFKPVSNN